MIDDVVRHKFSIKTDIETKGSSRYELIQGSTYDNPFLPPDYIENLESSVISIFNFIFCFWTGLCLNVEIF